MVRIWFKPDPDVNVLGRFVSEYIPCNPMVCISQKASFAIAQVRERRGLGNKYWMWVQPEICLDREIL